VYDDVAKVRPVKLPKGFTVRNGGSFDGSKWRYGGFLKWWYPSGFEHI